MRRAWNEKSAGRGETNNPGPLHNHIAIAIQSNWRYIQEMTDETTDAGHDDSNAIAVSDDYQLPPAVKDLHERFSDLHPSLVKVLTQAFWLEVVEFLTDEGYMGPALQQGKKDVRLFYQEYLEAHLVKVLTYVKRHPKPIDIYAAIRAQNSRKMDDINCHLSPREAARELRVTKQAICYAEKRAQEEMNLPPRDGQRNGEARQHMREARLKQIPKSK
jgi:hypothetical protein